MRSLGYKDEPHLPFEIEGQKDPTETRIVKSAFRKLNIPHKDMEGFKKATIVDEADLFDISGKRISADASYQKSTGEMRIERYLLTSPELNRVIAHEIGHNKWKQLGFNAKYEWGRVYQRGLSHGYKFPSFYATDSPEECFAECYGFYRSDRANKMDGIFLSHLKRWLNED